jgi:hypothetical protein
VLVFLSELFVTACIKKSLAEKAIPGDGFLRSPDLKQLPSKLEKTFLFFPTPANQPA